MISEGRLLIEIPRQAGGGVRITSSRPLHLTRSFAGKPAGQVAGTLPLIFSVCGMAQGSAAAGAAEEALGIAAAPGVTAIRRLLVLAETAREQAVRAVRDWPRFAGGGAPERAHLSGIMRWDRDMRTALGPFGAAFTPGAAPELDAGRAGQGIAALTALLETAVYGEPPGIWLARASAGELTAWAGAQGTVAQCLLHRVLGEGWSGAGAIEPDALPRLCRDALAARLFAGDAAAFAASPAWDGLPRESTPLTRERRSAQVEALAGAHGCGLGARLIACLVELARIPERMEALLRHQPLVEAGPAGTPARGIAQVEAVRGRLIHGVELEDGLVRRYIIVAPTEWNFHAQGAAMRGLASIAASRRDGWRHIADLYIATVDPCVGYELRLC